MMCGALTHGFIYMRRYDCGRCLVVGFYTRVMDFALHAPDAGWRIHLLGWWIDMFPENTPVCQWVLGLPIQIRYRLAHDGKVLLDMLRIFLSVVNGWYRKLPIFKRLHFNHIWVAKNAARNNITS